MVPVDEAAEGFNMHMHTHKHTMFDSPSVKVVSVAMHNAKNIEAGAQLRVTLSLTGT